MGADRRLTVVFPGATSPPRDGASAFVRAVLALLVREGHKIHLVVPSFLEPVEPLVETYASETARWIWIPSPLPGAPARVGRAVSALARSCPAWVDTYAGPAVVDEVRRAASGSELVVGFGAASSSILAAVRAPSLLLLFSLPFADVQRAGGSSFDRWLTRRFEARLPRRHDVVALTTPSEQERLAATSGAPTTWLPFPRGRTSSGDRAPAGCSRLLFIADWNYPPNRLGLEFLMADVMPEIWRRHPTTELLLAGKGSDELTLTGSAGPVRQWGQYGELGDVADGSTIAVLPLLAAGGVRTRLLELLDAGIPIIATQEATGGMDMGPGVLAVPPEAFRDRLLEVLDSPSIALELRRAVQREGGSWPSDADVAERWGAAFDRAIGSRATSSVRP